MTFVQADELSEEFAIELIDVLKRAFLAAADAQEQNCCAYAIQEVLSVFDCANTDPMRYCYTN